MPIITLRLSDEDLETIDDNAEEAEVTRSEYLRTVGTNPDGATIARLRQVLCETETGLVELFEEIQKVTE